MSKIFKILFMAISLLFLGTTPSVWAGLELEIRTSEISHPEKKTSREEIERDVENLNNRRRHLFETQEGSYQGNGRKSPPPPVALIAQVHFVNEDESDPQKNPFIKDHPRAEAVTILKGVPYPNGAEYEIEIYFRNRGTKDEPMAYAEAVSEEIRHAKQISRNPKERLQKAAEESEMLEAVLKRENDTELIKFLKRFLSKKEVETLCRNNASLLASIDVENFRRVITILGYSLEKEEISEITRNHLHDLLSIRSEHLREIDGFLDGHLEEEEAKEILKRYWKEITREGVLRSLQEMNLSSEESAYDQIKQMLSELKGKHLEKPSRNDRGKIYVPFSGTIMRLMDQWRKGRAERAEEERKGVPLDAVRNDSGGGSFAGSLTKFSLAVALKEAMKEALTGKDANFSHIFSDEQVVGYGAFSATAALGESLSVHVGDGIASRTGLKAFSSRASMISPYRLGSYAFFMTLGMQADQIARMTLSGMKDHKDVTVALSEALNIWWSQFEADEAALTTAGFLAAKPLISPFVRAIQSRWIEGIRHLQKSVRWGQRGLKVLEGATGNLTFMVIEEAIVLLTVELLMEEYVEWKKEAELKEKVGYIFKQLEEEVQKITKDNARESAGKMAALFEELRAVRIGVVHTEEGKVKDKYEAFQKALNELLDHKSGMFWKDTKAMFEGWNIRKSPEYEACQGMHKDEFKGGDFDGSQFERNYLCGHLAFLKIWASKLESVKKLYAAYQLAYATSENRVNHKKALTFDFLKDFDLSAIHSDVVLDIKHSNIRDIYQLEQSYYELALQKIARKFSGMEQEAGFFIIPSEHEAEMKAISDAINQVKEESMAGEIVFETSYEQIKEEDVEAELKRADLMPVILTEILKEDKFWIELGVGAKNGDGIFSTFNPKRIHVINDANCVLSEMLGISDDVFSLEGTEEKPWMSCREYGERFSTQDEEEKRRWLGVFIHGFLNSGISN